MSDARVVVLTRTPVPGRVKTRLIPALGPEGAAALHEAMALETVHRAVASGLPVSVFLDGDPAHPFAAALVRLGADIQPQAEGDLGQRLAAALTGPGRRVFLGTDCVLFDSAWLLRAARDPAPVVIGPAEDGGYWTIAVDHAWPALFQGVPWSTASVLEHTLAAARGLGLAVSLLPTCYDIDTPADLDRLRVDPACPPSLRPLLGHRAP